MPVAIPTMPGYVIQLPMPNDSPLPMAMTGWGGASAFKAILTEVSVTQRDNIRPVHSLQDLIYIYSFGRRIGEMRVAGCAFIGDCSGNPVSGIEYVQAYYDTYSVSTYPDPLTVVLGTSGVGIHTAFLMGLDVAINNPEHRICQFAMQLLVLPRQTGGG